MGAANEHTTNSFKDHPGRLAQEMAAFLLDKGIYVIGFSYPVVPMGQARIRVQLSALHTRQDLDFALEQFESAKAALNI